MLQLTRMLIIVLPLCLTGCTVLDRVFGDFFGTEARTPELAYEVRPDMTCPSASTQGTAQGFYNIYIPRRYGGGLPDESLLFAIRPYISDALYRALDQAKQRQRAQIAANPGEKPDFTEGDLFSSLFEGPERAVVIPENKSADTPGVVTLPVDFYRQETEHVNKWEDAVVLVQERGCWVIDDIRYGGNWTSSSDGTLRQVLSIP
ncbi:DUF3828 domain-containing protein [Enterobacillus tribolii]|uniref:Uncharacterized protein DUF3828 n=1 Tax=Enterobacillus tribolii TaxID=1487935 RepID=A0A370QMB8_9GAMM|nr:DUF3828 domain-containing protein [Enterobacillus tribolii]MBW7982348.1 DUF3828 domain-containing protein [Enterobacillus tribolii]RDK89514.1 uncharacterized protein DUF3828 [Enterobacillus tribolii]